MLHVEAALVGVNEVYKRKKIKKVPIYPEKSLAERGDPIRVFP